MDLDPNSRVNLSDFSVVIPLLRGTAAHVVNETSWSARSQIMTIQEDAITQFLPLVLFVFYQVTK